MTPGFSLLQDRRGAGSVQNLILVAVVALGGAAGIRLLAAGVGSRATCAGEEIEAMSVGVAPCKDTGAAPAAANQGPPPPPEHQPGASDEQEPDQQRQAEPGGSSGADEREGGEEDEDDEPEEFDPGAQLLNIIGDIIGFNDAKKCITEGDILACIMTALNFTPAKLFGMGFKLIANANRIRKAVDKYMDFLAARRAKKAADDARRAEEAARKGCKGSRCTTGVCFAPGTPVHAEDGLVPIEELQVGDRVWSRDEQTGEEGYRPILRTTVTPDQPLVALSLADPSGASETLEVTAEHPFYVEGRGWVPAGELRPDDEVVRAGGSRLRVARSGATSRRTTVYNFEVQEFHTYFVGHGAAWVHNDCLPKRLRNKMKRIRNQTAAGGNRGISGAVSPDEAGKLGEAFVGPGFRVSSDGKTLISADGLRQFRPPSPKRGIDPNTGQPFSRTGVQVNFETRPTAGGPFTSNVHLDVTP